MVPGHALRSLPEATRTRDGTTDALASVEEAPRRGCLVALACRSGICDVAVVQILEVAREEVA